MNVEKAQNAVAASEEHQKRREEYHRRAKAAGGATLQPMGLEMGALGKPNGQMPSPMYSDFNRV